jgi:hypothetical protein
MPTPTPSIIRGTIKDAVFSYFAEGLETVIGVVVADRDHLAGATIRLDAVIRKGRDMLQCPSGTYRFHYPAPVIPCITLKIPVEDAEAFSFALSDLLCWHRGYAAAKGDDTAHLPSGIERTRDLNIKLKSAIEEASK